MEVLLDHLDPVLLDDVYSSASQLIEAICANRTQLCTLAADPGLWQRHGLWRQSISIFFMTWLSSSLFYLVFGTVCYYRNFDQSLKKQPKFRPNQIRSEIADSLWALLVLNALTVPIFVAQVRGLAKIYTFGSYSAWYEVARYPLFVLFSDTCMYWLHRVFHHPVLFRIAHHKHHRFVIPTPFSAYAFDPIEAWIMSLPIYAYSFIWPMSDVGQLLVFFITNIRTFLLREWFVPSNRQSRARSHSHPCSVDDNRDQFHTVHHKSIQPNFGQFSALWDRLGGTYADPEVFSEPVRNKRERVKPLEH
ncbi:hypothetical protein C8A00DRAFT_46780 [Chaetomidium leptoderma]|uniref:Fatty acid hydroxylase domain-containing protein n=1 Tax=Chaetomidium leptoderma TaxID=669021 RepID=A0AAN6VDT9_9PEZI|nr:hypothetical protein C8A00DRAFT_46780 [Chaetomidium leptoderma]